jgi:DNA-binding CsgD family transcriptional regulator
MVRGSSELNYGMDTALNLSTLSDLSGLLYEGLAFPERWPDFLTATARTLECTAAGIVIIDDKSWHPRVAFSVGFPAESIREFDAQYGVLNPIVEPLLERAYRDGFWVGLARSLVSDRDYKETDYYKGWGRKYGVFHSVNCTVADSLRRVVSLTVTRAERRGPLGSEAVELVGWLLPHLKRAFQVQERIEDLRASEKGAREALEKLETAVIALGGDGRVVSMTRRAEAFLERNDGLKLIRGRLAAVNRRQAEQFDDMVRSTALTGAGAGTASSRAMRLHQGPELRPLNVTVMPHSSQVLTEHHPCTLVFISDPAARPAPRAALLSTLYGLTPAECRLADLLLEELDLGAVAERMRVTIGTARFMLKAIFHKTETRRQSHLVRLLMSLPADEALTPTRPGEAARAASGSPGRPETSRQKT